MKNKVFYKLIFGLLVLTVSNCGLVNTAHAQTRSTQPNDFSIELAGKGLIYSLSYQRMIVSFLGLQASLAVIPTGHNAIIGIPLSAKLYIIPENWSPFVTGGIVILTSTYSGLFDETGTLSFTGLGFEYRFEGVILLRANVYGFFIKEEVYIWPGLDIGYYF